MSVDWELVKEKIETELDQIMWDEPVEVKMSRLGVFPSGVGTRGQYLSNLFFQVADTQAMSWWTGEPAMRQALDDPDMSVEACKKMWKYMTVHMAHLMGDVDPPTCPAPWLNLSGMPSLCDAVVECLDSIETKDELADLLWSWYGYMHRLNSWFFLVFPWELGAGFPLKGKEEVAALVASGELPPSVADAANWKAMELGTDSAHA